MNKTDKKIKKMSICIQKHILLSVMACEGQGQSIHVLTEINFIHQVQFKIGSLSLLALSYCGVFVHVNPTISAPPFLVIKPC